MNRSVSRIYKDWQLQLVRTLAYAKAIIDFGHDEDIKKDDKEEESLWDRVISQMQNLWTMVEGVEKYAENSFIVYGYKKDN